jgi:competence protein ComEC
LPLLWLSIAFIIGIFLEKIVQLPWVVWGGLGILFLLLGVSGRFFIGKSLVWQKFRNRIPLPLGILLLTLTVGALRLITSNPIVNESQLAWYNDKGEFTIVAWISAPPDVGRDKTAYQMTAVEMEDPSNPDWVSAVKKVTGKIQVFSFFDAGWEYGDLLRFTAKPLTPEDKRDFSYKDYLSRLGIQTVLYSPQHAEKVGSGMGNPVRQGLIRLRTYAHQTIFRLFPQPESGLLAGILLGMDNDLPVSLANDYRVTGTSHIIAISGFNMVVIAGLFIFMFTRVFSRYWAALLAGIAIITYTIFVDGSASVIRAAIMSIIAFGGQLIGRRKTGLNALGFTAAVMCLFNPLVLWDISFQLSFMATFGLVLFAQPMQTWLEERLKNHLAEDKVYKVSAPLSEYFLFTLAAQITTLPVLAWHFKQISLISILANPIVLPFQPALLILGLITTIAGMILPFAGKALAVIEWPLLAFTNRAVQLLAKIKGGALTIHPALAVWIVIVVCILLLVLIFHNYFKKLLGRGILVWLFLALLCGSFTVWSIYAHRPDGRLHLTLQPAGKSSSIFIQTPSGQTIAVNPAEDMNELASSLSKRLSPWDYHLDTVILTDPGLVENIDRLNKDMLVGQSLLAPSVYRPSADNLPVRISQGIPIKKLAPNETLVIEPLLSLHLINSDDGGSAIELTYKQIHILIPNGVDYAIIKEISPESMQSLTALVLTPEDVSYIPPRVWQQLEPALVLWNSQALSPFLNSPGVDEFDSVTLTSDGETYQLAEK